MLLPSLTDFFFGALLIWLFVGGGGIGLLSDGDTGWHIRTGDYILEHHTVPQKDIFTFTRPNEPWFAWEWLCDVLFARIHQAWGLKGIVLLAGILLCLTATILFCHMLWSGGNLFLSLVAAVLANGRHRFIFSPGRTCSRSFYWPLVCGCWRETGAGRIEAYGYWPQ